MDRERIAAFPTQLWLTVIWIVHGLPLCIIVGHTWFERLVLFWSVYAIIVGHWGAHMGWRAKRAAEHADGGKP